mmetsp:Transcript_24687/g.69130  ORF Transcript_24687/g.69130 Transcript_24687/m.69130 type:complete len:173 (-) Transcript_24687:124-642(-)
MSFQVLRYLLFVIIWRLIFPSTEYWQQAEPGTFRAALWYYLLQVDIRVLRPGLLSQTKGSPAYTFLLRLLGMDVGLFTYIDDNVLGDYTYLSVGRFSVLYDSEAWGHTYSGGLLHSRQTSIGEFVTVASTAYVTANVLIDDNTTLRPGTYPFPGETLGPNGEYEGNPARKVV